MTKRVFGNNANLIKNFKIKNSVAPRSALVPVDIDSYLNRKTTTAALKQYIQDGFDMRLWDPPHVAELPDGEQLLFDGDHSRALWKVAFPNKTTMPSVICPVKDKKEISKLFVHRNKTGRIALKPSEIFVHEYHAGVEEAKKTAKSLRSCGFVVSMGTGAPGSSVGYTSSKSEMQVNIQGFRKAERTTNLNSLVKASRLYKQYWPGDKKCQVELLHAMALIYKNVDLSSTVHAVAFEKCFGASVAFLRSAPSLSTHYKTEGGNVTNRAAESIAMGFLAYFKENCKHYGIHTRTFNKIFKNYMLELDSVLKKD